MVSFPRESSSSFILLLLFKHPSHVFHSFVYVTAFKFSVTNRNKEQTFIEINLAKNNPVIQRHNLYSRNYNKILLRYARVNFQ